MIPTTILSLLASSTLIAFAGCSTLQQPAAAAATTSAASTAQATDSTGNQSKSKALSGAAALQGTWTGKELSADSDDPCRLIITGQTFEFHGADPGEWYKGTFTLREDSDPKVMVATISECPVDKYIGKIDYAIYRIENGTLTLTAREPGNPDIPSGFDAPETRRFVFKMK